MKYNLDMHLYPQYRTLLETAIDKFPLIIQVLEQHNHISVYFTEETMEFILELKDNIIFALDMFSSTESPNDKKSVVIDKNLAMLGTQYQHIAKIDI